MAKILLVEDDKVTSSMVRDWLENDRFTVEEAHTGEDALSFLRAYQYDLVVLDWMLPETSGVDVLKAYRSAGGQSPVLMLTGQTQIESKEIGLDCGADDYLTKPFDMRELSARIRALLRRPASTIDSILRCDDLELDTRRSQVRRGNKEIKLMPTEYALLEFLMRNQDRLFSSAELLERVWSSDSQATEIGVRTYITRLRKKIDVDGAPSLITNVHGMGYKLHAPDRF